MKLKFALCILLPSFLCAQEPSHVVNLRESYEREVNQVTRKYLAALEQLKNTYLKSGNFEAVKVVAVEIEKHRVDESQNWFVGEWELEGEKGKKRGFFSIKEGGLASHGREQGTWETTDAILIISWGNNHTHKIKLPSRETNLLKSSSFDPKGGPAGHWVLRRKKG